jgi:hypothetical protein
MEDFGSMQPAVYAARSGQLRSNPMQVLLAIDRIIASLAHLVSGIMQLTQRASAAAEPVAQEAASASTASDETPQVDTSADETEPASIESTPPSTTEDTVPTISSGRALGASGEFLWKPISDKDGKLAVLIPATLSKKIKSVKIISPHANKILATGKFSGIGNGNRAHFRFNQPGGSFPDGSIVLLTLKDGSRRHVTIKDTEVRFAK